MWIDGMYIPDLIADEVMASSAYPASERTVVDIKKAQPSGTATSTPPASTSNPTLTVLWVGVVTSIAGLALQTMRFMSEKKES